MSIFDFGNYGELPSRDGDHDDEPADVAERRYPPSTNAAVYVGFLLKLEPDDRLKRCKHRLLDLGIPVPPLERTFCEMTDADETSPPELGRLIEELGRGTIDVVTIPSMVDFGLNAAVLEKVFDAVLESDVVLETLKVGPVDLRTIGRIRKRQDGVPAAAYEKQVREESRGPIPYGYRRNPLVPKGVEIQRSEARLIERIFAMFVAGMSHGQIAAVLNYVGRPSADEPDADVLPRPNMVPVPPHVSEAGDRTRSDARGDGSEFT